MIRFARLTLTLAFLVFSLIPAVRADQISPRYYLAGAGAGGVTLFAGGAASGGPTGLVDIFDSTTSTWSRASLSQGRSMAQAAPLGNKIFVAGGSLLMNGVSDVVDIFDVGSRTWSTAALSLPRYEHAMAAAGTKLFIAGGDDVQHVPSVRW